MVTMTRSEAREQLLQDILTFKQTVKPIIRKEIPLDNPTVQPIRLKAGFKHNGEPTNVHDRLALFSVTWKNGRVMRNVYRPINSGHIKALDSK